MPKSCRMAYVKTQIRSRAVVLERNAVISFWATNSERAFMAFLLFPLWLTVRSSFYLMVWYTEAWMWNQENTVTPYFSVVFGFWCFLLLSISFFQCCVWATRFYFSLWMCYRFQFLKCFPITKGGQVVGEEWTGGLRLVYAHSGRWNDWLSGTCCRAQRTLPNILRWSLWEKNLKKNGCVYV